MKGFATAWVFFAAIAMSVLGVWFTANGAPLMPSMLIFGGSGLLFSLGGMLTRRW